MRFLLSEHANFFIFQSIKPEDQLGRGFTVVFSRKTIGFHSWARPFEPNFFKRNFIYFPPDGQTKLGKNSLTAGQFARCLALNETPG
jgi:hypothetical protein